MPALALGLTLEHLALLIQAAGGGDPNIISGALVLYNADDAHWYAIGLDFIGPDAILTAPLLTSDAPPGTPQTITLACAADGTTHVVGVQNDSGGVGTTYTNAANAGGVGESHVLSGYTLACAKDSGGAYSMVPT